MDMALAAGGHASHFGAGMSIIEILAVLYGETLKLDKYNPEWADRDRLILSKGHGVIGYYAALVEYGYISQDEMRNFEQQGSFLMGHPIRTPEHGIEFTNGSLGMGLSLAIGTALAGKKKGQSYRTYVILGDGEMDEGAVWEGIMAAPQFCLDNLCAVVDRNHMQLGGDTEQIIAHRDIRQKFSNFGWDAYEVDGHDIAQLLDIFQNVGQNRAPTAIIANTVKGKGFSFAENNNAWHHAVMTQRQYDDALQELEESHHGNH